MTRSTEDLFQAIGSTATRQWKMGSQTVWGTARKEKKRIVRDIGFTASFGSPFNVEKSLLRLKSNAELKQQEA